MKKLLLGLLSILALSILIGCQQDPEGLAPPSESSSIVGQAYYTTAPLTLNQLNSGVSLDSGWNTFIWTDELTDNVPVRDALNSVSNDYYYIYSYNERKYYFNPNQRYAQYNSHSYYSANLISELKQSNKYGLYMASAGALKYATSVSTGVKITMLNGSVINVTNTTIVTPNGTIIVPSNITIIQPNGSIVIPRNITIIINNTIITPTNTTVVNPNGTVTPINNVTVMCTSDVKQCPDGSYVGRNPYNSCQFYSCPATNQTTPGNQTTPWNQTCSNECSSGQKGCSGTQVWQCRIGSDGCYDRVSYNCGAEYICQNGVCVTTTNQTTPGNQTNSTY